MLSFLYVISMAVAFTNMFNGSLMPFYIKYIIALFWIAIWVIDIIKKGKIEGRSIFAIREYSIPFILIALWSLFVWCIDKPTNFSGEFVSRMISNVLYVIITFFSAISAIHFFGRKSIKLSVIAMFLSVMVNLVYVISIYGIGMFLQYLPNVLDTTDYEFGSAMYNFSLALEVQDITMASGFYLIYFLFFNKDDSKKTKIFYIILLFICAFIGFKRTVVFGLAIVFLVLWLVKREKINFKYIVYIIAIPFFIISFVYIAFIKFDIIGTLSTALNIDMNGRVTIYGNLAQYFDLSIFYLGKGFSYVDKIMYETTGFVAHSVIIKMYAEIGCIPFIIWLYHYLIKVPIKTFNKFGKNAGKVAFVTTLYLFATYFMENTMTLFCIQYSFIMLPLAIACPFNNKKNVKDTNFRLEEK